MVLAKTPWTVLALVVAMFGCLGAATAAAADPLGDAVDNARLTFSTLGDAPWSPTTADSVNGGDSAESSPVSFGQHSLLYTTVTGPGQLSFWWKFVAGPGDTLTLSIDGAPVIQMPGSAPWHQISGVGVGSGAHVVAWDLTGGGFIGAGLGRVDAVEFNTQPTLAWSGAAGYTSDGLEPQIGGSGETFVYRVKYTDPDGGAPLGGAPLVHIKDAGVEISGSPFLMSLVGGDPASGAVYGFSRSGLVSDHTYTYAFEARDTGSLPADGPPAGLTSGPMVDYVPTLTWTGETGYITDGVGPDGGTPATSYTYRVKYADADGDAPAAGYPKVTVWKGAGGGGYLPGSPFTMSYVAGTYATGAVYTLSLGGLTAHGDYAYRFDVQDAHGAPAGLPADASLPRGPIVNTPPTLDWEGGAGYTADGVEPNFGDASQIYSFRLKYADADGDPPGDVEAGGQDVWLRIRKGAVDIAGSPFQMVYSHQDAGAMYFTRSVSGLTAGSDYSYCFVATDRPRSWEHTTGASATGSPTSWTTGPTVDPANNAPTLDWTGEVGYIGVACAPAAGTPGATYVYRVRYADQDGDAPASDSVKVHIKKGGSEIAGSPFTMTWAAGTPLAGSTYRYSRAGLVEGADYTYVIEAQDEHGAAATGDPAASRSGPLVDGTPPVTTPTGLQAGAGTGWRNTGQSVTLSAGDAGGSGVASTSYQVDAGSSTPYTGAFVVSGAGNHVVTYHSTDAVGNVEGTRTGYVNIDVIAPVTSAKGLQADAASGWCTTSQSVTFDAGDEGGSGVHATVYQVDGGPEDKYTGGFEVSGEGSHTITYTSIDHAGNIEATQTGFVNIDLTAPSTSDDVDDAVWHGGPVTVHLTPTDADSGMDGGLARTECSTDGGRTWQAQAEATFRTWRRGGGSGVNVLLYRSTDNAGNSEGTKSCEVRIDRLAPVASDDGDDLWHRSSQTLRLAGFDGDSGMLRIVYSIDGRAEQTVLGATADVLLRIWRRGGNSGIHTVAYRAWDALGNVSNLAVRAVKLDGRAPRTTDNAPGGVQTEPVTVLLTATDAHSGVAGTWYTLDDGDRTLYEPAGIHVPASDGVHTIRYYSTDNVGRTEMERSCSVTVDLP